MPEIDAALEVGVIRGHVRVADLVVNAGTRTAHGGDDVVAGPELGDVGPHFLDAAKALVADNQKVVPIRRGAILRRVDFLVGAVNTNAKHFDQYSAAAADFLDRRSWHLG